MIKQLVIVVIMSIAVGRSAFAYKNDPDYLKARKGGAIARIELSLVDDEGIPASNAAVRVLMGMNFRDRAYYINGSTNTNGEFLIEGKTTGNEIEIEISKDGYYKTSKKFCFATMGREYDVKDGRWQPWGMKCHLKLRPIRNPITLVSDVNGYYIPDTNRWIGFDMLMGDWVQPDCKGMVPDFEVYLEWDGKPSSDSQRLNLNFRAVDAGGGFYYADTVEESLFHGVYCALTNKVFLRTFSSRTFKQDGRLVKQGLPISKILVLRSRCVHDEMGMLRQANYSTINFIGVDGRRDGKGEMLLSYTFNPTTNDMNLEDNKIFERSRDSVRQCEPPPEEPKKSRKWFPWR